MTSRSPRARRRLASGLAATALVLASSACIRQEGNATSGGGGTPAGPVAPDNLPDCPVDALETAEGTVDIELWHSFVGETKLYMEALTEEYNASQDKVNL
ncbi:MAG TPA: hypothetical protein VK507_07370, partial [Iamia sp.]|nr:hypothetical protein [Iamia sp.]